MPFFGPPDIKKLEAKRDVNGLMRALGYKDSSVGRSATRALGRIGAAPEPLVARLADGNWNTTWHVEETLVALGASAVPAVVTALTGDSPKVRHSAARILGQIRSPAAVEPLIAALWDQDDVVRDLSAAALCNIAYADVSVALKGQSDDVRRVATDAMAKCRAQREAERARKAATAAAEAERNKPKFFHTPCDLSSHDWRPLGHWGPPR